MPLTTFLPHPPRLRRHRQGYIVPICGHMANSGDTHVMIAEEVQTACSFIW